MKDHETYVYQSSVDAIPARGQVANRDCEVTSAFPARVATEEAEATKPALASKAAERALRRRYGIALKDYSQAKARWDRLAEAKGAAASSYQASLPAHYEELVARYAVLRELMLDRDESSIR